MEHFKTCKVCNSIWKNRNDFLKDPEIILSGYQVNFDELEAGFFLFNHEKCENTLMIHVEMFAGLYDGPIYEERMTGTDVCPGYCLYQTQLNRCKAKCECAFVREIMQIIKEYPKSETSLASG